MPRTNNQLVRIVSLGCVFGAVIALGGCRDYKEFDEYYATTDAISTKTGNAVAHNMALQTIDPWPEHAGDTRIDVDGKRILKAVEKYRNGGGEAAAAGGGGEKK